MNRRKLFGTMIGIIIWSCCIVFFTFAYYTWKSEHSNVVLGIQDLSISCIPKTDVEANNIGPVLNYQDGVKAEFSIDNGTEDSEVLSLSLNITSVSENLLVESFKYTLVYDTTGGSDYDYDNPIVEGDFSNFEVGKNIITSSLTVLGDSTYSYQFIVYIDGTQYNDPNMQENSLISSLMIGNCGEEEFEPTIATEYIKNLYNDESVINTVNIGGDTSNPTVSLNATQGIMLDNNGEYRYYGANPNNYVSYNNELWRIISVSNVKLNADDTIGETRVKIIRDESIGNYSWDTSDSSVNSGYGVNDWTKADLMTELNTLYYNKRSGTCYNGTGNTSTTCDFTSIGLNNESKDMIDNSLWYLGGSSAYEELYADDYYTFERGTTVYDCSTDDGACPRATSWTGKIGLIYPSDYAYATDLSVCTKYGVLYNKDANCYGNNWLYYYVNYYWAISPLPSYTYSIFHICSDGYINPYGPGYDARTVFPVMYLKSNVIITGGTGTSGNPYQLEVKQEPNAPNLDDGNLIPVYYDDETESWKKADSTNSNNSWYNYDNKMWANAILISDTTKRSTYQSAEVGTTITDSDITAFYVWIPRYKYRVWNITRQGGEESTYAYSAYSRGIDIVWEQGTNSTGNVECTYNTATVESETNLSDTCIYNETDTINTTSGNTNYRDAWYTHSAFTFGNEEITGFWIGKFETTGSASVPTVLPDLSSLINQNVSTQFTTSKLFQNYLSSNIDAHMLTNLEWGSVVYLTHSIYGLCNEISCRDVYINNSGKYYTGRSGGAIAGSEALQLANIYPENSTETTLYNDTGYYTYKGYFIDYDGNVTNTKDITKVASTTGNITGVYDMSGGANDNVMGNMVDSSNKFYSASAGNDWNGSATLDSKYYNSYSYGTNDIDAIAFNRARLGDATAEVIGGTFGSYSTWRPGIGISGTYSGFVSHMNNTINSWFNRGGFSWGLYSGIFNFGLNSGLYADGYTFRCSLS